MHWWSYQMYGGLKVILPEYISIIDFYGKRMLGFFEVFEGVLFIVSTARHIGTTQTSL